MTAPRPIPVITDATGRIHRMGASGVVAGKILCQNGSPDFAVVTQMQALVYRLPACQRCWLHGLVEWPKAVRL